MEQPPWRQGLAKRSDLGSAGFQALNREMRAFNESFMEIVPDRSRRTYKWSSDPISHWSRSWEYPFCAVRALRLPHQRILDAGSGITFFPFFLASRDNEVLCADLDPEVRCAFGQMMRIRNTNVEFVGATLESLPFENEAFDSVISISVLEHIRRPLGVVSELGRVVKPGGHLILTHDLCLGAQGQIDFAGADLLIESLERQFEPDSPIDMAISGDVLTNAQQIRAQVGPSRAKHVAGILANYLMRRNLEPVHLAVVGYSLRKLSDSVSGSKWPYAGEGPDTPTRPKRTTISPRR